MSVGTFLPVNLSDCVLWLDGSDHNGKFYNYAVEVVNNVTNVTQWFDKSGQNNHAILPTSGVANNFTVTTSKQNNRSFLTSTSWGLSLTNPTVFPQGSPGQTVFIVSSPARGNSGIPFGFSDEVLGFSDNLAYINFGYSSRLTINTSSTTGVTTSFSGINIYSAVANRSNNTIIFKNGNTLYTNPYSTNAVPGRTFSIGRGTFGYTGSVYEIVVYNRTLTTQEQQKVEGYLAFKWGLQTSLPAAHTFKSSFPAKEGTLQFTLPLRNIIGFTGSALTVDPVEFTSQGTTYSATLLRNNNTVKTVNNSYTVSLTNLTSADAGTYTFSLSDGTTSITSSSFTIEIADTPSSLTRNLSTNASFTTSSIPSATYSWLLNNSVIASQTARTYTITSTTSNSYGRYNVIIRKDNVSWTSPDFSLVQNDTPINTTVVIPKMSGYFIEYPTTLTSSYVAPTKPYQAVKIFDNGAILFRDSASAYNLLLTEPGYINKTSPDGLASLYLLPRPRTRSVAPAIASPTYLPFLWDKIATDASGTYFAVLCKGTIGTTADRQFIEIYKFTGSEIIYVQQILNTSSPVSETLGTMSSIAMSYDGQILIWAWGSSIFIYKKNAGQDTWGSGSTATIIPTSTTSFTATNSIHRVTTNHNGSIICANLGTLECDIFTSSNLSTWTRNTTLKTSLNTLIQRNVTSSQNVSTLKNADMFTSSDSSYIHFFSTTNTYTITFKFNPTTFTATFLHSNNSGTIPSFSKSDYFIVNNTEAVVKKIPPFYIRTTVTSGTNPPQGEIATNEGNSSTRYFLDYRSQYQLALTSSTPIMLLSADGRRIFVQNTGNDKDFYIADVSFSMTPYIPTIGNTNVISIGNQNEFTTTGSFFYIDNIINNILKQTGYGVNGILLRFGDNRSNINNTLTKVGDWRVTANNTTTAINMASTTSTQYSISSKPWYIYRNQNPGSTTTVNTGQYVQFNCLSTQVFNSELFDTSNCFIEYKLWNGLGNVNNVTVNGNVVIIDNENDPNLPFSPQTGKLNIFINNLPDLPDRIGRIITPLAQAVSGTSPTKYKIVYNKKKYSLNPPVLTLQEMIRQFRPTSSKDIPVTSTTPYENRLYKGGFAMRIDNTNPRMTVSYDIRNANGTTSRSNWIVLSNTSGAATYYFKQDYNYSFIMYGNTSATTPFISLWSGQRGTSGDNIIDFSENSNAAGGLNSGLQSGDAEPANAGTAKVVRSFSGDAAYDFIDVVVANNIKPILKTTGPYTIKNSLEEEEVIDSFNSESDIKSFSIPDLFYGIPNSNGVRDPASATIRAGTSNTSNVDVYDPDISGDEQIFGIVVRLTSSLSTTEGKWQYTTNGNTSTPSWTDMYRDANDANKYLRLWNYNKTDNKVRIRFRPATREETGYVSLPFQVYDGSDFIPYEGNVRGQALTTIESTSYTLADSWMRTSSTSLSTNTAPTSGSILSNAVTDTIGTLRLKIKHINNAPSITANKVITSLPYRFNSGEDISANSTGSSQFRITNKTNNTLSINLSDIVNDIGFTDADINSRTGIVISNLDVSSVATVQVEYNTKEVVTIPGNNSIAITNGFHLPAGPRANAPYTRTISNTNPNLTHWYDFSDLSTISLSGEKISAINNKVNNTNSRRLTQINDGFKPTIVQKAINGFSCARFNRLNSTFLEISTSTPDDNMAATIASTNSFTILLAERRSYGPASGDVPLIGHSSGTQYFTLTYRNQTNIVFGQVGSNEATATNTDANNELTYNDGREPVRVWRFVFHKENKNYDIYLNTIRIGRRNFSSVPLIATQYKSTAPAIGRIFNSFYDGDMCEIMVFNSGAVSNISTIENYLMYKWQSASLLIQPVENKTTDISMNIYAWDQSNRLELQSAYGSISARGGITPYSENGARIVLKIQKSNTCPVLSMDPSGNSSTVASQSTTNQLVFDLGKFEMTNTRYEITTESLFVNTIKTKYTDIDADNDRGLAITSVNSTIGTWYAVKPDGTTVDLTSTSQSNAYLMRSSPNNKLRVVLRSSDISLNNYFHTSAKPGRPGSTFFTTIGWDNTTRTGFSYSEYTFVNVNEPGRTDESTFSDPTKSFRFNIGTRPYITSTVDRDMFVFNSDETKTTLRVNNFQSSFVTSQPSSLSSTKRIDIADFINIGSGVLLQYRTTSNQPWQALTLPLNTPLNGNYDIRIDPAETPSLAAINAKSFIINLTLYDTATNSYSANYGYFNINVAEANLPPSISINTAAPLRSRIDDLSSTTIKYETIFNDILSNYPLLNFGTLTSSLGPIVWTDNNVNSILKTKGFAMEIINNLNGTFFYQDSTDTTFYPIGFTDNTSRILLNYKNNIRFIPQRGTKGSATIRLYAWDGVSGENKSTIIRNQDGTYNGGAFSSSYITVEFPVIPRNTAPKLLEQEKIYDLPIPQTDNNDDISGNLISDFVNNVLGFDYEEADAQNTKGIALIGSNTQNLGVWQYSTNNGALWTNISSTFTNNSALHLLPTARIRFQFTITTGFRQSYSALLPTLTFRAWDGTNELASGSTAQILQTGDFEAYSSNTALIRGPLTHVNHAPSLALQNILLTDSVSVIDVYNVNVDNIVSQLGTSYIDTDLSDNKGLILVDISSINTRDSANILGVWSYTNTTLNNVQQRINDSSPTTTLMVGSNTSLRFNPETLSKGKTTLTFALYDGQDRSTQTFKYELTVTDVNYAPTFNLDSALAIQPYDISYNTTRVITVQSILNQILPSDINENTSYGLVFDIQRLAQIGKFEYTINPNASSPIYTEIINSRFGNTNSALHLPSTAAIRYTPAANENVSYSINCILWDRTNNGSILQSNGYASAVSDVQGDRGGYTPYSLNSFGLVFNNKLVNYAPVLNNPSPIVIDVSSISCTDLLSKLTYTDENANDSRGLVFIANDIYGGHFEYSLDDGSSWTSFPTLSETSGWHTTITATEYIRYVKDINVDDTATLTVIAWDRTNTTPSDTWPAIAPVPNTRGGNTPYSANTATFQFSQSHINTRPTLGNSVTSTIGSVLGTSINTTWVQINTLLRDISDVDLVLRKRGNVLQVPNPKRGIVVTDVESLKGTWQWSLSNTAPIINTITGPSQTSALILDSATYIRFIPAQNRTQTAALTYRAWDGTASSNGRTIDISAGDSPTASFSTTSATITASVVHVNEAPILTVTTNPLVIYTALGDSTDTATDAGVSIKDLIDHLDASGLYIDNDIVNNIDPSGNRGIAITQANEGTSNGTVEYTINGGTNWTQIPSSISTSSALLLTYSATNRIRLRPNINASGLFKRITFFGWDTSDGATNGSSKNITNILGGSQAYSLTNSSVVINTAYINRRPVLGKTSTTVNVVNGDNTNNYGIPGVDLVGTAHLTITDRDTRDLKGIAIIGQSIPADASGVFEYKMTANGSWIPFTLTAGNALFLSVPANAIPTNTNSFIRSTNSILNADPYSAVIGPLLRFRPTQNPLEDKSASLTLYAWDGTQGSVGIAPYGSLTTSLSINTASVVFPIASINSSPTISAILDPTKIRTFRADNKLTPRGGQTLGITVTQILNDMGYTDVGGALRGMAIIDTSTFFGAVGNWSYKIGNGPWTRFPQISSRSASASTRQVFFIAETTNGIANRIRFDSTSNFSGLPRLTFYGWDQSDPLPTSYSGSLRTIATTGLYGNGKPLSANAGIYNVRINAIPK